jgi:hypothetical protein
VKDEWDIPDDNYIYLGFIELKTEGGLYFKDEYMLYQLQILIRIVSFAGRGEKIPLLAEL